MERAVADKPPGLAPYFAPMQTLPITASPRQSTRVKIGLAFAALALVLFTAVGALAGNQARQQTAADSAVALRQLATRMAEALGMGLEERFREVRNLARLEPLIGDEIDASRWRALLERTQANRAIYSWIGVATPDGTVLAATGGLLEGRDVSKRPWFHHGREAPYAGDVHDALLLASQLPPRPAGEPLRLLDFAAPVRRDQRLVGVLGAHLDVAWIEQVRQRIARTLDPASAIEIFVVDRHGVPLTGPLAAAKAAAVDVAAARQRSASVVTWADGRTYLTTAVDVFGSPDEVGFAWAVLARQPVGVAQAAADRLQQRIWALGLVGALLFGIAAWWLAGWLTAPLRRVVDQARQLAHDVRADEAAPARPPKDEFAQIAQSLEALVGALQRREGEVSQLVAANSGLDSFSRNVSHDLKGPIGSIGVAIRMVLEQQSGRLDAESSRLLSLVGSECDRLRELVDDLLALAKIDQHPLHVTEVSMAALVDATLGDLKDAVADGPSPEVDIGPLPTVKGDAGLIRQVWHNLIGNAFKFSAKTAAPRVQVFAQRSDREWVFCVADNGAGFDGAQAHRLFGVFQRLHPNSEFPGSGVGLSIVRRIVSAHGGRVWAEGERGAGARFFFSLPADQ